MATLIARVNNTRIERTGAPESTDDRIARLRRELGLDPRKENKLTKIRMEMRRAGLNPNFFTA
jgi:hypothetical protein